MERCAGVIIYRNNPQNGFEVLLAHPGGPFFKVKDYWGIPKGHVEDGESPLTAACREFSEETGCKLTDADIGNAFMLGTFQQNSHKKVTVYALEKDYDVADFTCNECTIEYPAGSGETITFKENDKIAWFDLETAYNKVFQGQGNMILALKTHLMAQK